MYPPDDFDIERVKIVQQQFYSDTSPLPIHLLNTPRQFTDRQMQALSIVERQLNTNDQFAWSMTCRIAKDFFDSGTELGQSFRQATIVIKKLFNCDIDLSKYHFSDYHIHNAPKLWR